MGILVYVTPWGEPRPATSMSAMEFIRVVLLLDLRGFEYHLFHFLL